MGIERSMRVNKPRAGKQIKKYDVRNAKIKNCPAGFLRASVPDWTQPAKVVAKIEASKFLSISPSKALNLVRDCFQAVAKSSGSSKQLSRYASNCYEYSKTNNYERFFLESYATRKASIEDDSIRTASSSLARKGIASAAKITEHSFEPLVSAAIEQVKNHRVSSSSKDGRSRLESGESDSQDDDSESFWNDTPSNTPEDLIHGPDSNLNHTPEKPKLTTSQIQQVRSRCQLGLSGTPLSLMSLPLREIREKHNADQYALATLKSLTNLYQGLVELMQGTIAYEDFPLQLWLKQNQSRTWDEPQRHLFRTIALTLTDFWGISTRKLFDKDHERSFWVESVVPMFKYMGACNELVVFSWCEAMVGSHKQTQIVPGVWMNETERLFADGVGKDGDSEVVLMESSSCYATERVDHTMEDTWKLIRMITDSLRMDLIKYQDGRFETAKNLAVYGIQCIKGTVTMLKATVHDQHSWQVVELRSGEIPTKWSDRYNLMKVFELLSTLDMELSKQKVTRDKLMQEKNHLVQVDATDTVRWRLKTSHLIDE